MTDEPASEPASEPATRVVRGLPYGTALVSTRALRRGDVVLRITDFTPRPRPTVQTGRDAHSEADSIRYLNHSCEPNVFIDVEACALLALRDIGPGTEMRFFYPSTEWRMDAPFTCLCGAENCLREVDGAHALTGAQLASHRVNPHITALLAERDRTGRGGVPG